MNDSAPMPPSVDVIPGDSLVKQESGASLQRVLLITDRVRERHVLMSALDDLPVASAFASSREDALRLADSLRPDVVVVDVELKGEEGWLICERLLEKAGVPSDGAGIKQWHPGFVVLHGNAEGVQERARANGLDQMLRWPFAVDEARSLLDLVLEHPPDLNALVDSRSVEISAEVAVEVSAEPRTLLSPSLDSSAFAEARAVENAAEVFEHTTREADPETGASENSGPANADMDLDLEAHRVDEVGEVDHRVIEQAADEKPEVVQWDLTELVTPSSGFSSVEIPKLGDVAFERRFEVPVHLAAEPEENPSGRDGVDAGQGAEEGSSAVDLSELGDRSSNLPGWQPALEAESFTEDDEEDLIDRLLVEADLPDLAVGLVGGLPDVDLSVVDEQGELDQTGRADSVGQDPVLAAQPTFKEDPSQDASVEGDALVEDAVLGSQEALSPILSDLFSVDGVSQVMLLETGGGVVFTSSKTPQFSLAQLAGHSVQIFSSSDLLLGGARSYGDADKTLETDSIVVEGDNCCVLLQRIDALHRLVVCVENAAGLGQVRFLIRRLHPRLRRALRA